MSFASQGFVRLTLTLALAGAAVVVAMPACSSGEDFTGTGGKSNSGGSSGDASTTGGSGGTGGTAGGAGSGGVAGTGTGGVAGTGTGGIAGSAGGGGTGGNPNGKADGQPCASNTECKSNYCVDEVCCESECAGDCRSCKVSGKEGLCTPYAQGTDPEGDCVGAGAPTDPCAGTCDGKSACDYPDGSKGCGAQVCTNASQSTFACDNAGACKSTPKPCDPYQCSGTSCLTTCSADAQCINTAWCDLPKCVAKLSLGGICPKDSACQSGNCVAGLCCSEKCGANFTCESGTCKCNGVTCAAGASCVTMYKDIDLDGFGDPGSPVFGCTNPAPSNLVANSTDCDDADKDAFPGQTKYFDVPRKGKGGYDYNCDNKQDGFYPSVTVNTCKICNPVNPTSCGILKCEDAAGFGCAAIIGCPLDKVGFGTDPGCGNPGTLQTCVAAKYANGTCTGTAGAAPTSGIKQLCH